MVVLGPPAAVMRVAIPEPGGSTLLCTLLTAWERTGRDKRRVQVFVAGVIAEHLFLTDTVVAMHDWLRAHPDDSLNRAMREIESVGRSRGSDPPIFFATEWKTALSFLSSDALRTVVGGVDWHQRPMMVFQYDLAGLPVSLQTAIAANDDLVQAFLTNESAWLRMWTFSHLVPLRDAPAAAGREQSDALPSDRRWRGRLDR